MKSLRPGSCLLAFATAAFGQALPPVPNSWPQVYPGEPGEPLSPVWQNYYLVDESKLPNITFPLTRSFAGNIPINRAGHPNDTLFFWAFEKEEGSLTVKSSEEPWLIWLNGGPGSSSMIGLTLENGPIRLQNDYTFRPNNYSWNRLVDSIWIDQPVGTGFSTADTTGYVLDAEQMSTDFVQFLDNLVKVFPSLATRPLHLAGESYAGRWIPYITKALFSLEHPPVKLSTISIGDGTIPSISIFTDANAVTVIETFPQLVGYDTEVFDYFVEQTHLCGYDLNLTYPQHGYFPTVAAPSATDPNSPYYFPPNSSSLRQSSFLSKQKKLRNYLKAFGDTTSSKKKRRFNTSEVRREKRREQWKRDLSGRSNGTIDSWYACNLLDEMFDYATNFTFPWTLGEDTVNEYDIPDALDAKPITDSGGTEPGTFFNDDRTRTALHAPTSKDWVEDFLYPFNNSYVDLFAGLGIDGDTSPDSITFFSDLAKNASERNVGIVIYSGNWDGLVAHHGSQIAIQNTTFGGIQGFTRKPSTPWYDDDGKFAGIIHQERGITYTLFQGANHLVPQLKPEAAFVFLREFVLGHNKLGLVEEEGGHVTVVGGEDPTLAGNYLSGGPFIYYGSLSTQGTVSFPSATVKAWDMHLETATAAAKAP